MKPCPALLLCAFVCASVFAQSDPWAAPRRGSWVQTGLPAPGDVTLANRENVAEIVVASNEASSVRQAAEFLAGDIEKITGRRPPIVDSPSGNRVNIRLITVGPVTVGNAALPATIDAQAMNGQW